MANDYDDTVRRRSGWLIPIAVFVVTAALSALFLLFYLAPAPSSFIEERPTATTRDDPVHLSVNGLRLVVPANYLVFSSARSGGERREISLFTTYPDFKGYESGDSDAFTGNASDSPAIFMLIRSDTLNLTEQDRLDRIYLNYVVEPKGTPGPFGLTQYVFRDDSGYRGEDLFVGSIGDKPVVMRCVRFSESVPSPSCLRDLRLGKRAALSYRFKRAQLAHWQDIAVNIQILVHGFIQAARH